MEKEIVLKKDALTPVGFVKTGAVLRVSGVVAQSLINSGAAEIAAVKPKTETKETAKTAAKTRKPTAKAS
jgi:hypothetical protein